MHVTFHQPAQTLASIIRIVMKSPTAALTLTDDRVATADVGPIADQKQNVSWKENAAPV